MFDETLPKKEDQILDYVITRPEFALRVVVELQELDSPYLLIQCHDLTQWYKSVNILQTIHADLKELYIKKDLLKYTFPIRMMGPDSYMLIRPWKIKGSWYLKADQIVPWHLIPEVNRPDDYLPNTKIQVY